MASLRSLPQLPLWDPSANAPGSDRTDGSVAFVCGVDEAGRGPLAGPVVAAAVILDPSRPVTGLADSKRLVHSSRARLADEIRARARAWSVGLAEVEEIDRLNILHATMLAMRRAVDGLGIRPSLALIDGNRVPALACEAKAIVGGDGRVAEIAAASIIAKVTRDAMMDDIARDYPQYGFERHRGYPTADHVDRLRRFGACPHHRRSFAPVRSLRAPEPW